MGSARTSVTAALIALLVRPELALACTVCGAAEDNNNAFLASTIALSLLPLGLIFGGVGLIWYHNQPSGISHQPSASGGQSS